MALLVGTGCAASTPGVRVSTAPEAGTGERECAWFGDARDGVLYFGRAAFWSAYRAHGGDPSADLRESGVQRIGRFGLTDEKFLPPLEVSVAAASPGAAARTGVWDVLAHPNGRVYFTTYFDAMGAVDLDTGAVERFPELGTGLNEIAPGPDGDLLVTRYGAGASGDGSIVRVSTEGARVAELPLRAPLGYRVAPKSVAFDPGRDEIWVTTDLLPVGDSRSDGVPKHDAIVLALDGRELRRIARPEIQFVAFGADRTRYVAEAEEAWLWLRITRPDDREFRVLLDDAFSSDMDFAQDIQPGEAGRVVVTRWSGTVHIVDTDELHTLKLPALEPGGLYYTGVLTERGVCVTYCAGITVVCESLP